MPPDYEELTEAARRLAAALRIHVAEIQLLNGKGRPLIVLQIPPARQEADDALDAPLTILRVLRDKQPLTGLLLYDELQRAGVRIGKSTLDRLLAKMVSDGDLANPQGAKPPGYRLPAE